MDQLIKLRVRFLPCTTLKNLIDQVEIEFDGVYDIAEDTENGKFYRKVACKMTVAAGGENGSEENEGENTTRQFTLTVQSANTDQGSVTGGGTYDEGSSVTITATPNSGYVFEKWSDGNTSATRTLTVTEDLTLTASFKAEEASGGEDPETPPFS